MQKYSSLPPSKPADSIPAQAPELVAYYADRKLMVYKKAPEKDVGSITSSNSAIRNAWNAVFGAAAGWIIFWCHHNYSIGYIMSIIATTAGFTLVWVYRWLMNRSVSAKHPNA